jgi:hypothetical protein
MRMTVGGIRSQAACLALAGALAVVSGTARRAGAQEVDSLALFSPPMSTERQGSFVSSGCSEEQTGGDWVVVNWANIPDSVGARISAPNLGSWENPTAAFLEKTIVVNGDSVKVDTVSVVGVDALGLYTGSIDRTIRFRAQRNGIAGLGSPDTTKITTSFNEKVDLFPGGLAPLRISFEIAGAEEGRFSGFIFLDTLTVQISDVDTLYAGTDSAQADTIWTPVQRPNPPLVPGEEIELIFDDPEDPNDVPFSLGLKVRFSPGRVDSNGTFRVACQDFEGFHVWRGFTPCIDEMTAVAEFSKQEAFVGFDQDSCYYEAFSPEGPSFQWVDTNVFNGFTYYYAVTTFDRGYNPVTRQPTHPKVDSHFCDCDPSDPFVPGNPKPCDDEADVQVYDSPPGRSDDLSRIYAYPNPYRSGASAFITPNYHNFPDESVIITNVPSRAEIKIFTVSGDLVWEFSHQSTFSGNVRWPVKNLSGENVSSGVYIFRVEAPSGVAREGKIIVIR